jgi:hypothetical protein
MLHQRVQRLEFSVDGLSLSVRVRRARVVVLAVRRGNVPVWLRGRAGQCIRRVRSRVVRADRAAQDRDFRVVRGRALARGQAVRVARFRRLVRHRRASGRASGRVSGAAASATRR